MRKRHVKQLRLHAHERLKRYGLNRSRGHRSRRRGRRIFLRREPPWKNRSSMPPAERIAWLQQHLALLEGGR